MNLCARSHRALLSLPVVSLTSRLTTRLTARPTARITATPALVATLGCVAAGLLGTLTSGVARATPLHPTPRHAAHHRRVAAHRSAPAASSTLSAGAVSGILTPPASNLDAVLNPVTSIATVAAGATQADFAARYELRLHHLHTGEDLDIVYRIGNQYIPSAIAKLNYFLRDHRTMDVSHYDPREFDLLHTLLASLGKPSGVIDIVCGYRTPWSNNYLRTRAAVTGVAKNSQHMQAKAIDIRIPGVSTSHLRDVALSLHGGGVGYYPLSEFVHVDVGPVRQWSFGGRGE